MAHIIYNSKKYELPKKTMKILEAEDVACTESNSLTEAYTKQFNYISTLFDENTLVEMFGSSNINDVDLMEVVYVSNLTDSAYTEKINEEKMKKANAIANSDTVRKFNETVNNLDKAKKAKTVR